MAKMKIADVQIPENWGSYVAVNSTEKTALWTSGVVAPVSDLAITAGGKTVNVPFLNDLSGEAQILSDTTALTVNKVGTGKQTGVIHARGNAFSVNDLAAGYAGTDVVGHIAGRVGAWWGRVFQRQLIASLEGVFASASMASNVHDITGLTGGAENFSASAFIDAEQKLGDARGALRAVACHSSLVAQMRKADLVSTAKDSEGRDINVYQGKQIIEIDTLPTGVAYLLGSGVFGFAEGMDLNEVEVDRDILAGDTVIATRRSYVLHPMGVSFTGTVGETTPSDADLKLGTNYGLVVDPKLVAAVAFKFVA